MRTDKIVEKTMRLVHKLNERNGRILDATEFMRRVLPKHYTCEPRKNGVYCNSLIGVDENDPEHWDYIYKAILQKFGKDFMEVFCQTCTNYMSFTVYIRF